MEKKVTGKEVRYTLLQNNINLSWLSQQLGISPQTLQSRLNAQEFKRAYMIEITNILGRDIFGLDNEQGSSLMKQPVLDIRVCAGNGIGLEGSENKVAEYVSIPSMQGCIGQSVKTNRPIFNYVKIMSHHANEAIRKIVDNIENSPSITDREKT